MTSPPVYLVNVPSLQSKCLTSLSLHWWGWTTLVAGSHWWGLRGRIGNGFLQVSHQVIFLRLASEAKVLDFCL